MQHKNIEHLRSLHCKLIASVILPPVLEGDEKTTYLQKRLTTEGITQKEALVFDQAMNPITTKYWKDATFNGSDVLMQVNACLGVE